MNREINYQIRRDQIIWRACVRLLYVITLYSFSIYETRLDFFVSKWMLVVAVCWWWGNEALEVGLTSPRWGYRQDAFCSRSSRISFSAKSAEKASCSSSSLSPLLWLYVSSSVALGATWTEVFGAVVKIAFLPQKYCEKDPSNSTTPQLSYQVHYWILPLS